MGYLVKALKTGEKNLNDIANASQKSKTMSDKLQKFINMASEEEKIIKQIKSLLKNAFHYGRNFRAY